MEWMFNIQKILHAKGYVVYNRKNKTNELKHLINIYKINKRENLSWWIKQPHWMQDYATHARQMNAFNSTTCWNREENNWDSTAGANERCMCACHSVSGEWQWRHADTVWWWPSQACYKKYVQARTHIFGDGGWKTDECKRCSVNEDRHLMMTHTNIHGHKIDGCWWRGGGWSQIREEWWMDGWMDVRGRKLWGLDGENEDPLIGC